jgi:hypothetical protein
MDAKQKIKAVQDKSDTRATKLVVKSKSTEVPPLKELNQEFKNYILNKLPSVRRQTELWITDYSATI